MLVDTHAHVYSDEYESVTDIIQKCKKGDIKCVVDCSIDLNTAKKVLDICSEFKDFLIPSIGIHPQESNNDVSKDLDELERLVQNNKVFAIGEIGLDYHYDDTNKSNQIKSFIRQLDIATKYDLPVIVHTRDSLNDTLQILKKYKLKGIIHCFSYSNEIATEFIKLGYYLGIGGVITFKNCKLIETIKEIGISNIVLETDSPYMSPEPLRGKVNLPLNVSIVAEFIANSLKINYNELLEITYNNFLKLRKSDKL